MIRIIIFLIVLYLPQCFIFSQNNQKNQAKYWVWRDRLVNDFMIPGTCDGCGIIMNKRGNEYGLLYPEGSNDWYSGGFDIGDEGFQMGKYLIVLATEWKLLKITGWSTNKTEIELYYELKTIDRLDKKAEYYWSQYWPGSSPSDGEINGFMIRDDVFDIFLWYNTNLPNLLYSPNAYNRYLYLNQGDDRIKGKYQQQNVMPWNPSNTLSLSVWDEMVRDYDPDNDGYPNNNGFSGAEAGIHASDHQYMNNPQYPEHITGPTEYSHDNYIGLLQGLVAIQYLIDTETTVYDPEGSGGYINIKEYTGEIIDRIIHYIKTDNWTIKNPVTGECVRGVFWRKYLDEHSIWWNSCVSGGAMSQFFSGEFSDIHNMYTETDDINGIAPGPIGSGLMQAILFTLTGNKSNDKPVEMVDDLEGNNRKEFQYLDLYYCLLHGGSPERGFSYYKSILNNANCCSEWSNNLSENEYSNMLTEMIVFNLVLLLQNGVYKENVIVDSYHHYPTLIDDPDILLWPMFGTNDEYYFDWNGNHVLYPYEPRYLESLEELQSSSTISEYDFGQGMLYKGWVEYKAGSKIRLTPGFKVSDGAYFHAYIEEIDYCKVKDEVYDYSNLPFDIGNLPFNNGNNKTITYSNQEGANGNINEKYNSEISIKIYPNPNDGIFEIFVSGNVKNPIDISVSNILGEIVYDNIYYNNTKIVVNISKQPPGIYNVIVRVDYLLHEKIIIK